MCVHVHRQTKTKRQETETGSGAGAEAGTGTCTSAAHRVGFGVPRHAEQQVCALGVIVALEDQADRVERSHGTNQAEQPLQEHRQPQVVVADPVSGKIARHVLEFLEACDFT